ncbi:fungal-specific transcription factor domain-containing protein, partial [Lasiosphaeria ovina]
GLPNYSTNVINNTSAASYSSPSAIPLHHLQQSSGGPPQTLPPLQPSNPAMQQPPYGGYPPTSRATTMASTPGSTNTMASYPPPPPQNAGRGAGYPMMANNGYGQQPYPTSSAMLPQTTTAASHSQPIAPAPSPGGGRVPPVLRPMPAGGVMQQGMNSPYGQSPLMAQQSMLPEGDQPTHVVGSQGRRGILPSAPGRPAAPQAGAGPAKSQIPQKDADGKFPCPHCTKTYLHAKHLKRHLLRHTGDRPYMCVLCRDTFSRSDILKRHFIKCSVRRGNPTGASHLSHPQAHVKKNAATQQKTMGGEGDVNHINGMGNMPAEGMVHPFGLIPAADGMSNIANDQSQLSRSSSINRLEDANRDRRSMTGSVMGNPSTRGGSFDQQYNGGDANNMTSNINPQLANYSLPQGQNGMQQMFAGSGSTDWSQMFQAGAHTSYVNMFPPNVGQTQTVIKQEPNPSAARAVGVPGETPTDSNHFPSWGVPPTYPNSYQLLSRKIISFLSPQEAATNPAASNHISLFFQPGNIRNFLENYTHFHTHFSIFHIPTFKAMDVFVGLLAGMCCIGACYSDRVSSANVREIMDYLKAALEASSRLFASISEDIKPQVDYEHDTFGSTRADLEELQAIILSHILFVWHGTSFQREKARSSFALVASLARNAGLLQIPKNSTIYSQLHQSDVPAQVNSPFSFDWMTWVEQEKRIRTMYLIFLFDVALGLYFNAGPQFDALEIRLPLPADDAVWDASSACECAEALGLHGSDLARMRNPDGTQRCKQPEMHLVLKALLESSYEIQPGATNLQGKFILIHALLAMMKRVQLDGGAAVARSSTPLPQNAWFIGGQGPPSANSSGRVTPVDMGASLLGQATTKTFLTALQKFKYNWDSDMVTQFPPSGVVHPRRYGFSRDGIHFYWLATYLLSKTRMADLRTAPDQRFTEVIHLLKSVKNWVMTDGAARGEELGSVGDIDDNYGLTDLTLDMTQLFKPLARMGKPPRTTTA